MSAAATRRPSQKAGAAVILMCDLTEIEAASVVQAFAAETARRPGSAPHWSVIRDSARALVESKTSPRLKGGSR